MLELTERIRRHTGYLAAPDGTRLFWQGLEPGPEALGAVGLVHGYSASSDFLLPMMHGLAEQGLACYAIDCRGHGRSAGVRQHVFRFQEYLSDVRTLCAHVRSRAGDGRVFLYGNSLGGLIGSLYGLSNPHHVDGLVLTAPFFGPAFRVPRVLDCCGRAVSLMCPTLRLPRRRPDLPKYATLRWWTETVRAQQVLRRLAPKFTLPVLILHGQADGVACPRAARSLFERLGSRDKTFRIVPGATHRDLDPVWGAECWTEVREWLASRVPGGEGRLTAGA